MIRKIHKALSIFIFRLKNQGLLTTFHWVLGRIVPGITGIPNLSYCRIRPNLLVGTQFSKNGAKILLQEGVTAVVNLRIEFDDQKMGIWSENYCYLPTIDDDAPSIPHLDQGVDFIHRELQNNGKVYIHCGAGIGRAPTMAAAYLMSTGLTFSESEKEIKKIRPFIHIMPPQLEQLSRYEKVLAERRAK